MTWCAIGVIAAAGLPGAAHAQTYPYTEWWNPSSTPVSGDFSNTANWDSFTPPSTSGSAFNSISFGHATPADFVADNDLLDGLRVWHMDVFPGAFSTAATARITGLPLRVVGETGNPPVIFAALGTTVFLETPLKGTDGLWIEGNGRFVLNPSSTSQHTLTGGLTQSCDILEVSSGPELGAISNTFTMDALDVIGNNGVFRATAPFSIAIPFNIIHGSIETAMDGTLTLLQPIEGISNPVEKLGPGTLSLAGENSTATMKWRVVEGTLLASTEALGDRSALIRPGATLRLAGDNTIEFLSNSAGGVLDLNGHSMTLADPAPPGNATTTLPTLVGTSGSLILNNNLMTHIVSEADLFQGDFQIQAGRIRYDASSTLDPAVSCEVSESGALEVRGSHSIGSLSGVGLLDLTTAASTLEVGQPGSFSGAITGSTSSTLRKSGAGTYVLDGDLSGFAGTLDAAEGILQIQPLVPTDLNHIAVAASATASSTGFVGVSSVTGDGTLEVITRLTIGESGASSTFDGAITSSVNDELRKRGAGVLTLTGDTSGFQGFFDVLGGTARIPGGSIFPNAQLITVNGAGTLEAHGLAFSQFVVVGRLISDQPGQILRVQSPLVESLPGATIEASNGSTLEFRATPVTQSPTSVIRADAATVLINTPPSTAVSGGAIEAVNAGLIEFTSIRARLEDVSLTGSLLVRIPAGIRLETSSLVLAPGDTLTVELGSGSPSTPVIDGVGTVDLSGTLEVILDDGYTPAEGDSLAIFDTTVSPGLVVTDNLSAITLPDVSPSYLRLSRTSERLAVEVAAPCPADFAEPFGILDFSDVLVFLVAFGATDPIADLAAPTGVWDFSDVIAYLTAFGAGCP